LTGFTRILFLASENVTENKVRQGKKSFLLNLTLAYFQFHITALNISYAFYVIHFTIYLTILKSEWLVV